MDIKEPFDSWRKKETTWKNRLMQGEKSEQTDYVPLPPPPKDKLRFAVALALMGGCCGLLPGVAQAGESGAIILNAAYEADNPGHLTFTNEGTTLKGGTTDSPLVFSTDVTGGLSDGKTLTIDGAVIDAVIDQTIGDPIEITASGTLSGTDANDYDKVALTVTDKAVITGGSWLTAASSDSGKVSESVVTIEGGSQLTLTDAIAGGYTNSGAATHNAVIIQADAEKNEPVVDTDGLYGGYSNSGGSVSENKLDIRAGKITPSCNDQLLAGGNSGGGSATKNSVDISGGTISNTWIWIVGGSAHTVADSNTVNISGGQVVSDEIDANGGIEGGRGSTEIKNNVVNISGGTVRSAIYGGFSFRGTLATDNQINIWGSAVLDSGDQLYGYQREEEAIGAFTASGNNLNLGYDSMTGTASAWTPSTGSRSLASLNNFDSVNFYATPWENGGTYLTVGSLSNVSSLDLTNMTLTGTLTTGDTMTLLSVTDGTLPTDKVKLPTVPTIPMSETQDGLTMTGTMTDTFQTTANAITCTLGDATITGIDATKVAWSAGTTAFTTRTGEEFASGTTLDQSGIHFTSGTAVAGESMTLIDGTSMSDAGWKNLSLTGTVDTASSIAFEDASNGVTISGKQSYSYANDQTNRKLTATFGSKDVTSIKLGDMAWGTGRTLSTETMSRPAIDASDLSLSGVTWDELGTSTNLLETVKGGLTGSSLTQVTKDYEVAPAAGVTALVSGTVAATSDTKLDYTLDNVESITFGSGVIWDTGGTLLDLSQKALDLSATVVNTKDIAFTSDSLDKAIKANGEYKMTLLKTASASNLKESNLQAAAGETSFTINGALTGKGTASYDQGNILYTIKNGSTSGSEQSHHSVIGAAAAIGAVSTGAADTVETAGAAFANVTGNAAGGDTTTFSNIGGGSNKFKTGSSVTTRLWQATMGAGARHKVKGDSLFEYALYYEGGRGNYTTYNEQAETSHYGSGRLRYNGGGLYLRYELPTRVYAESSVHTGRMNNEARNVLYDTATKQAYGYDKSSSYYGWHLGIGKICQLSSNRTLDVYGKYFFNKNAAMSYDLGNNHFDIDAVSSKQMRLGFRLNQQHGAWKLYYGGAFDYEFDGKSTGTVSAGGMSGAIRAASTKGASGMIELGYKLEATEHNPWEIDLNLRGFAGRHQGAVANIGLKYMFI
jgi:hypothetical protein